jgi:predicted RNA-binding protein with PUA-like domain
MKSEPDVFSIDQLEKLKKAPWDGVRNYQVRNMFRDEMKIGDLAYFYHSSCDHIGIAGIMEIISKSYPDPTFKDKKVQNPWLAIDVKFVAKLPKIISRQDLQSTYALKKLKILEKGCRLSVTKITNLEFEAIKKLSGVL